MELDARLALLASDADPEMLDRKEEDTKVDAGDPDA